MQSNICVSYVCDFTLHAFTEQAPLIFMLILFVQFIQSMEAIFFFVATHSNCVYMPYELSPRLNWNEKVSGSCDYFPLSVSAVGEKVAIEKVRKKGVEQKKRKI